VQGRFPLSGSSNNIASWKISSAGKDASEIRTGPAKSVSVCANDGRGRSRRSTGRILAIMLGVPSGMIAPR
jgi:hypothetical protein